jgi:hypothetical protein
MFTVSRFRNLSILQKSFHHQIPQKKTYASDLITQNIYFITLNNIINKTIKKN